jgi:predicted nucleic acid-binding protein
MRGVLVDTSVWVDFFNNAATKESDILTKYIKEDYPAYLCAVILQEILQGFNNDKDYAVVKDLLLSYPFLKTKPLEFAVGAAEFYRKLKKADKTIRKSNDCLIAYHALFYNIPVLHRDRDFSIMAQHSNLKVITVD